MAWSITPRCVQDLIAWETTPRKGRSDLYLGPKQHFQGISLKYAVPRGSVQNLAQTCHGFATGMIKFCERMGWRVLAAVLDHMLDRLRGGTRADLLEMAQVACSVKLGPSYYPKQIKSHRSKYNRPPVPCLETRRQV